MKKFIDRKSEMETLQNEYKRDGSALVILYGRRRVGKTTLITEFIKNKKALFFLASEESEVQNRNSFKEKAADFINSDLLKNADVKSWDIIFKAIADTSFDSKPIIVIDEFQYIGKANPSFPSIFSPLFSIIKAKTAPELSQTDRKYTVRSNLTLKSVPPDSVKKNAPLFHCVSAPDTESSPIFPPQQS